MISQNLIQVLKQQSILINKIRNFFQTRAVLEVQTPILYPAPVTDPYIDAFEVELSFKKQQKYYLQTSPEYAMKRLLAAGSGPIYQICKVFRNEPSATKHHPEFLMLEWYRPGFSEEKLIQEVSELLTLILGTPALKSLTYKSCFETHFGINPHEISQKDLILLCKKIDLAVITSSELSRDDYLSLLFTHRIEKTLGLEHPVAITHFPVSQAALAKKKQVDGDWVASRFEVYYQGLELANAYDEEISANNLRNQFEIDLKTRAQLGLKQVPIDEALLAITDQMPTGCGIAMGLDRLLLLALKLKNFSELMPFFIEPD